MSWEMVKDRRKSCRFWLGKLFEIERSCGASCPSHDSFSFWPTVWVSACQPFFSFCRWPSWVDDTANFSDIRIKSRRSSILSRSRRRIVNWKRYRQSAALFAWIALLGCFSLSLPQGNWTLLLETGELEILVMISSELTSFVLLSIRIWSSIANDATSSVRPSASWKSRYPLVVLYAHVFPPRHSGQEQAIIPRWAREAARSVVSPSQAYPRNCPDDVLLMVCLEFVWDRSWNCLF